MPPERNPFKPAKDYDALLKQAWALDNLERQKQKQLNILQNKDYEHEIEKMKLSHKLLNSEKDMNEKLTNYIEILESKLEQQETLIKQLQSSKV